MNDDHLDELASAHLDGATTAQEASEVAADPAVLQRIEELRAVRSALRSPATVDLTRRDAAVAAALAAYDEGSHPAEVTRLGPRRARRAGAQRSLALLGAAAALVLLVALVPLLGRLGDTEKRSTAAPTRSQDAPDSSTTAGAVGDSSTAEASGSAASSTTAALSAAGYLGDFATLDELVAAVSTAPEAQLAPAATAYDRAVACTGPTRTAGTDLLVASATVGGTAVAVEVGTDPSGQRLLRVLRAIDCVLLTERVLGSG